MPSKSGKARANNLKSCVAKAAKTADFIEMKELTSAAFDALLAPIVLINDEGHIIHCNHAARELLASTDPICSVGHRSPRAPDAQDRHKTSGGRLAACGATDAADPRDALARNRK
jgi:PAS domain-containing protein